MRRIESWLRGALLVPCLLLLAAGALSACGGGGSSADEARIEETIEVAATSSDPQNCTRLQTQKFDEQNSHGEGAAAVEACEREAEEGGDTAESVDVSEINVDGGAATAEVSFSGGGFDGQALEVRLAEEQEGWKLDEVVGFTEFDAGKLAEAFEAEAEAEGEIGEPLAACLARAFGSASQSEAEELMFSGSDEPIEELIAGCR